MNLIPEWAISYTTSSLSSDHVTVKFLRRGGVKGAKPVKELAERFAVDDDAPMVPGQFYSERVKLELDEMTLKTPHRQIDVYDVLAAFTGRYSDRVRPMVDEMVKLLLTGGSMADVRDLATRVMNAHPDQ